MHRQPESASVRLAVRTRRSRAETRPVPGDASEAERYRAVVESPLIGAGTDRDSHRIMQSAHLIYENQEAKNSIGVETQNTQKTHTHAVS